MPYWGVFPFRIEELRALVRMPDRVLVFPPVGLGDFVVALTLLRPLAKRFPESVFAIAGGPERLPLYRAALAEQVCIADPADPDRFDLALVLNDSDIAAGPYAGLLAQVRNRLGSVGGKHRPRHLNQAVVSKRLGKPRHEALRNSRLLLPFGIRPETSLAGCVEHCRLSVRAAHFLDGPYVVLHPYTHGHTREWPIDRFIELAKRLIADGTQVAFTGTAPERERLAAAWPPARRPVEVFDAMGQLDLDALLGVLASADAVVAGSTGPLHLAAALGTRTLGLYPGRKGQNLERWLPVGRRACGIQPRADCAAGCSTGHCACMTALSVDLVLELITAWRSDPDASDVPDRSILDRPISIGTAHAGIHP